MATPCYRAIRRITFFQIALFSLLTMEMSDSHALIVKVAPIQVCNDAGGSCANAARNLLEKENNKIWAQAGIKLNFLAWSTTNETDYLSLDDQAEVNAFFTAAPGANTTSAKIINMWFVDNHFDAWGEVNSIGGNKIVIDDGIFSGGPKDTIAHEIGHILGLKHDDPGMDATYLMPATNTSFTTIGDIVPDGAMLEKLTRGQATTSRTSTYVLIPEPTGAFLLLAGIAMLVLKNH